MIPYLIILSKVTAFNLFDKSRYEKPLFWLLCLILFIFTAFRVGGTGTGDYDNYISIYNNLDTLERVVNPNTHAEIGFRVLSLLGNTLGFDGQFIIASMAFLSFYLVAFAIYRYSPYRILSLLIWFPYILAMNMQSSRISVAAAFGLLFFISVFKKKKLKSILFFLLALSFHNSALVLLLVLFTVVSINMLSLILLIGLSFKILFSPFPLIVYFFDFFNMTRLSSFIEIYVNSEDYGYPMRIYDPRIFLALGFSALIFISRNHLNLYFNKYYFKLFLIGTFLLIFFSDVTAIALRASYFFLLVSVLTIPWLAKIFNDINYRKEKIKRVGTILFVFIYFSYSASLIYIAQPYQFILG